MRIKETEVKPLAPVLSDANVYKFSSDSSQAFPHTLVSLSLDNRLPLPKLAKKSRTNENSGSI